MTGKTVKINRFMVSFENDGLFGKFFSGPVDIFMISGIEHVRCKIPSYGIGSSC